MRSTIAGEVEHPQRDYPRVMLMALAVIVLCYAAPVAAVWHAGIGVAEWTTGSWIAIAGKLGGPLLGMTMAFTALVSTFGIFNSLTLSLSRFPGRVAPTGLRPPFSPSGWVTVRRGGARGLRSFRQDLRRVGPQLR